MASHSDPVSVPPVKPELAPKPEAAEKPEPTTTKPEAATKPEPAAATAPSPETTPTTMAHKLVSTAAKAGMSSSLKTKVGIVVGGTVLTLVGGAFGIKSFGSGTPQALAQSSDNKNQFITPAPKPEPEPEPAKVEPPAEPRKLPGGMSDLPLVEVPKIPPVGEHLGRREQTPEPVKAPAHGDHTGHREQPIEPVKIQIPGDQTGHRDLAKEHKDKDKEHADIKIPELTPPPIPSGSKEPGNDHVEIKIPAPAPVIKNVHGDVELPALPAVHNTKTVKQDETIIHRVGAVDGKDKTETAPPPKAPVLDLDTLPAVVPPPV
ncbi:hypothetical protein, partial [Zavarzinella formosa]|uniref:hypothetical protein n=1 Tax=Zavarzinella formosa TaxID=360055 RepID=UPI001930B98B